MDSIPEREWKVYTVAIRALSEAGVPFMLGGGFAFAGYTGRWRDTKDIDFYIEPKDRERAVQALASAGFGDYYSQLPYDRKWIYRSTQSEVIVDVIWAMANQRAQVDRSWFDHAPFLALREVKLPMLAIEEMIWCKLYILQRDRCDWTDVFNLVYAAGALVDWERLIARLAEDTPLLAALLTTYRWLDPSAAMKLPDRLWRKLRVPAPRRGNPAQATNPNQTRRRAALLDSRAWFAGVQPVDEKLEI